MSAKMVTQLVLLGSAGLFTGLLLFVADVLQRIYNDMTEREFARFLPLQFKRGGYSVFAVASQSIPFFGIFIYPIFFGFGDVLFLAGLFVFNLSIVASRFTTTSLYKKILETDSGDAAKLNMHRKALGRGNSLRAPIALAGFILMLASLL